MKIFDIYYQKLKKQNEKTHLHSLHQIVFVSDIFFWFYSDATREIIIDGPPMLLNTPSQTRSSLVSTLPGN